MTDGTGVDTGNDEYVLKRFGDVETGDFVPGPDGNWVEVEQAWDEHMPESMYEVESDSGETVVVSGNHLWYVETSLDRSAHRNRRREGAKLFSKLTADQISGLLEVAEDDRADEVLETALIDMIAMINCEDDRPMVEALARIAISIGHISENDTRLSDLYEDGSSRDDTYLVSTVRFYDARLFAQQILSLTGQRKFRRRWPLLVGRVVTTEEMFDLMENFEVSIPDSRQSAPDPVHDMGRDQTAAGW